MSQQTVTFNLDVPYKDQNGEQQTRTCVLTLTLNLSVDDSASLEGGCGQITVQGAVMPVENPKDGSPATEEPPVDEGIEQQAA